MSSRSVETNYIEYIWLYNYYKSVVTLCDKKSIRRMKRSRGSRMNTFFRVVLTETFETKSSCRGISQLHSWKKGNLQFFSSAFAMTSKKHPSNLNHPSWLIHPHFSNISLTHQTNHPNIPNQSFMALVGFKFFQHLNTWNSPTCWTTAAAETSIFSPDFPVAKSPTTAQLCLKVRKIFVALKSPTCVFGIQKLLVL